jgi:hypothetical protein
MMFAPDPNLSDARRVVAKMEFHARGTVPTSGIHRDQPGDAKPGRCALLSQAGYGREWIKEGKQAAKMTRFPVTVSAATKCGWR